MYAYRVMVEESPNGYFKRYQIYHPNFTLQPKMREENTISEVSSHQSYNVALAERNRLQAEHYKKIDYSPKAPKHLEPRKSNDEVTVDRTNGKDVGF